MNHDKSLIRWVLLIYKLPSQPSRLRLQIWRRLQRMGALYVQDGACLLPAAPEHVENMQYIAAEVKEMGGTCYLFSATSLLPSADADVAAGFRALADGRFDEIANRLDVLETGLETDHGQCLHSEDALKRERLAYLRAQKLAYFGSDREKDVRSRIEAVKRRLDSLDIAEE